MQTQLRPAGRADLETLIGFMRVYYQYDRIEFDEEIARDALQGLVGADHLGRAWLIVQDGLEIGYIVTAFGYSLEFGGREANIDEFFIQEGYRGKGVGTQTLRQVEARLKEMGIAAIHLEVEQENTSAQAFYRSLGFTSRPRFMNMTKRLEP